MPNSPNDNSHPDESAEALTPELGHPVNIFIDTSIFEAQNYAFGGTLFRALIARVIVGDIRIVISEITRREVKSHLAGRIDKAKAALGRFRKEAKILKGLPRHDLAGAFTYSNWDETKAALIAEWDSFLSTAAAEVLPIDGDVTTEVFDDYFARREPFSKPDKKSEFPDAFVIKTLRAFCAANECPIVVVSHDNDFQAVCDSHPLLVWWPDLSKVLEHSARLGAAAPEVLLTLLSKHRVDIDADIVASFTNRGFYWDSDEGHDSEVEEVFDEEVVSLDVSVVDIADEWAEVVGEVTIRFRASVHYPDPDMGYRDDESKEWMSFGSIGATLSATSEVPISFRVNVAQLKKGTLEIDGLDVNNSGDVWFSEDEVEEITRPDYSQ